MRIQCLMVAALSCVACNGNSEAASDSGGAATDSGGADDTTVAPGDSGDDGDDDSSDDDSSDDGPTDGGDDGAAPYGSGTRLRAVVEHNGAGEERFARFFDSELGVECFVGDGADGVRRCLPGRHVGVSFSDAACTQRAARSDCELPQWVRSGESPQCAELLTSTSVWIVGTPVSSLYRLDSDGECVPDTGGGGFHLAEEDPTIFAEVDTQIEDVGGGLGWLAASSDDGAHTRLGPIDVGRELFCRVNEAVDDGRCVAFDTAFTRDDLHTNASCTASGVAWHPYGDSCVPPIAVRNTDGSFSRVGTPLDPADLFQGSADSCQSFASFGSGRYFAVVPWSGDGLPAANVTRTGEGRLQARHTVTADGTAVAQTYPAWHDTELDMPCHAQPTDDGTLACAPTDFGGSQDFFADAMCTVPLSRRQGAASGWTMFTETACPAWQVTGAALLGNVYSGLVYDGRDGLCEPLDNPESWGTFYEYTTIVDSDALAVIEEEEL